MKGRGCGNKGIYPFSPVYSIWKILDRSNHFKEGWVGGGFMGGKRTTVHYNDFIAFYNDFIPFSFLPLYINFIIK